MPLHDWTERAGWEGMHHLWIAELLRWIKPRLPSGYRAYIGSAPLLAIGAPVDRPDVGVRAWPETGAIPQVSPGGGIEPDEEIAVATLDSSTALMVQREGCLIAALEIISPRNKDRPAARVAYLSRYLGYLLDGVHLMLIDVHRRPLGFSFADQIAQEFGLARPPCPAPCAVSYRVGEPAAQGGRFLALWQRPLAVDQPLPTLPLPLCVDQAVPIDLEATYLRAAEDVYLT